MKQILIIVLLITVFSCGGPEARRPVKVKTGNLKSSVDRNRKLLALEEAMISKIIEADSAHTYTNSATGSWYYHVVENTTDTYTPLPDDLVTMSYNIVSFNNDTIYSMEDIGVLKYKVDKQELFPGLRHSVKLLKKGETATFLYPSSLAYGYHGDEQKIGVNVPIKATVTLFEIEKQNNNIQN